MPSVPRARLFGVALTLCATSPHVTPGLGVAATTPSDQRPPSEVIETADAALYRAKDTGRNRVETA